MHGIGGCVHHQHNNPPSIQLAVQESRKMFKIKKTVIELNDQSINPVFLNLNGQFT